MTEKKIKFTIKNCVKIAKIGQMTEENLEKKQQCASTTPRQQVVNQ